MSSLIDARIRILIDGYEKRIAELQQEVIKLEQKLDAHTALEEGRPRPGFGL
jgi:hypothetical protein